MLVAFHESLFFIMITFAISSSELEQPKLSFKNSSCHTHIEFSSLAAAVSKQGNNSWNEVVSGSSTVWV